MHGQVELGIELRHVRPYSEEYAGIARLLPGLFFYFKKVAVGITPRAADKHALHIGKTLANNGDGIDQITPLFVFLGQDGIERGEHSLFIVVT